MTQKKEYINFDSTDRKFMLFDITLDVNLLIPEKICDKGVVYLWMFLLVIFFQICYFCYIYGLFKKKFNSEFFLKINQEVDSFAHEKTV